jgi:hypothetical protein
MRIYFYALLLSLPLAAQSLSLSCPSSMKFNQPTVCTLNFAGGAAALEWNLTVNPSVPVKVQSLIAGKSVAGANSVYALLGMNTTPLAGSVATITIPARAGSVTLTLSKPLGSSAGGHAVEVDPGVSVTVQ